MEETLDEHPSVCTKFSIGNYCPTDQTKLQKFYYIWRLCLLNSVTGPLNERQIGYVCRETMTGLRYLHSYARMHRDIKGANILLTDEGEVKLGK